MELNERKLKILQAIIKDYLTTAEPVGSRTISKNYNLGISPATIRNEMSDLEELGFIVQPHTSAGRIPSDKAYRLYVDTMLELQKAEFGKLVYLDQLLKSTGRIENLLKEIARLLAQETHYTTFVTTPQYRRAKVKNLQLIDLEEGKLLVVVVTDTNHIKNRTIRVDSRYDQTVLNRLSFQLNEQLYNLSLEEIGKERIESVKQATGEDQIVGKILDALFEIIHEVDDMDIYTSGTTNILHYPEFADLDKASALMRSIEERDVFKDILNTTFDLEDGKVKISIGDENELPDLKACSLITTSYHIHGERVGAIGIIGPKRMDYYNTVYSLRCLIKNMDELLNRL
ncbi:heat-inducible transcriptional repressor HrcA [Anaerotalea alkaliphila]|uniref:Heat-inducible transcription repressor HrcA n=1 Tax=Anaerotalea alkaliphila TaxID=2662126 RepID=A0A7X5HX29_9FIRM|nr:heat-inducible transcriptional repressor HrcA [Anaerotalea alkaliphila]NDL68211.1 heat-inducible transcription repressor HrcA [Anaerotalea alkaliphila]